jgi:hypothetical protein
MAVSNITGRDDCIINKALWFAIRWINSCPKDQQCGADRDDMQRLLNVRCPGAAEMFTFQDDLVRAVRLGWELRPNAPLRHEEIKAYLNDAEAPPRRGN